MFFFVAILWAGRTAIIRGLWWGWAIVTACAVLGTFTIPIMVIPIAAAFLWFYFLIARAQHRVWGQDFGVLVRTAIVVVIAIAVLYIPVFVVNGHRGLTTVVHYSIAATAQLERLPAFVEQIGSTWTRDYPRYIAWCLFAFAVLSPLIWYHHRDQLALLVAAAATSVVLYLLVVTDVGYLRVWLFLLPLFLIMASSGVEALLERVAAIIFPGYVRFLRLVYISIAVGLSLWIGNAVVRNQSVLASQETGVFLGAHAAAEALLGASGHDMVAIDLHQSAPVVYYALRLGTPLSAMKTVAEIHYYTLELSAGSSIHQTAQPWLFIVVDKDNPCCSVDSVMSRVAGVFSLSGHWELVSGDAHMAVYRAGVSSP